MEGIEILKKELEITAVRASETKFASVESRLEDLIRAANSREENSRLFEENVKRLEKRINDSEKRTNETNRWFIPLEEQVDLQKRKISATESEMENVANSINMQGSKQEKL